jgi:hypothetical protein
MPRTVVLLLICVALPTRASAQVRGAYSPGSTLTQAGTDSGTGWSYSNQVWRNSSNRLVGPDGKPLGAQAAITIAVDNNTVAYVPQFKVLGAELQFSLDVAVANGSFAALSPFLGGSSVNGGGAGLTTTTFVPFSLGWSLKHADIQTGYSVYAPTGRYQPGSANNLSSGFWTNSWQTGATIYLTGNKATQVSLFDVYAWNTTQRGTGIGPGQNDSLDYSLTQTISLGKDKKWTLQAGAAGYGQWQTTGNTGQAALRPALKYAVNAAGFTINLSVPVKSLNVGVNSLWEYGARNTMKDRRWLAAPPPGAA